MSDKVQECMNILKAIDNGKVSASMSGIEYYFEYIDEARRRLRKNKEKLEE